jgi:hypothetical protein
VVLFTWAHERPSGRQHNGYCIYAEQHNGSAVRVQFVDSIPAAAAQLTDKVAKDLMQQHAYNDPGTFCPGHVVD